MVGWLELLAAPDDVPHGRRHRRADRRAVVAGVARLALRGAAPALLDHDRGRHPPGRARPYGRAVRRLAGPGRAPPGVVHERRRLAARWAAPASWKRWCTTRSRELERSYEDNERKIRGLIHRAVRRAPRAASNTSDNVSETCCALGSEIPALIEKLSGQQVKLAKIIKGAGENLTALETALARASSSLENALGGRTEQLQNDAGELHHRALPRRWAPAPSRCRSAFEGSMQHARHLARQSHREPADRLRGICARARRRAGQPRPGAGLSSSSSARKSLDDAFDERLRLFDESIMRSTSAIDARRRRQGASPHHRARRARHRLQRDHRASQATISTSR